MLLTKTNFLTLSLFLFVALQSNAQTRTDGTFVFQTDTAKKYSLYIPSGYDTLSAHRLMIGLHPFNVLRWNAESWCDTLIAFAETNNLILACPDGDVDGKIDDPIDTAFTSALIDSMLLWYNIDTDKIYAMGFSWGGRTTYTYGLSRPDIFKGYLVIGAAINGTTEVTVPLQQNANNKPVYIVHGSLDATATRFFPIRDSLISKGAFVKDTLMPGIAHTIDFPNRNQILTDAFKWIDSVNCSNIGLDVRNTNRRYVDIRVIQKRNKLQLSFELTSADKIAVTLHDLNGRLVYNAFDDYHSGTKRLSVNTKSLQKGIYVLNVNSIHLKHTQKIFISR